MPRQGIEFEVPVPTQIVVRGIDKQMVGQTAAEIRRCARRSRTRARASATRASTFAGRSGSGHERRSPTREARLRRHRRVRGKIAGTAERPRLAVFRSNRGVFAQLVDDVDRQDARRRELERPAKSFKGDKRPRRTRSARRSPPPRRRQASRSVVFDRGGYLYHGRVKALAEGAREGGLSF